jgi:hypothetical protein
MSKVKQLFFVKTVVLICQMARTMQLLQRWNTIAEEIIQNKRKQLEE